MEFRAHEPKDIQEVLYTNCDALWKLRVQSCEECSQFLVEKVTCFWTLSVFIISSVFPHVHMVLITSSGGLGFCYRKKSRQLSHSADHTKRERSWERGGLSGQTNRYIPPQAILINSSLFKHEYVRAAVHIQLTTVLCKHTCARLFIWSLTFPKVLWPQMCLNKTSLMAQRYQAELHRLAMASGPFGIHYNRRIRGEIMAEKVDSKILF